MIPNYRLVFRSILDWARRVLHIPFPNRRSAESVSSTISGGSIHISDGVDIISLKVWSEDPKGCAEHCWHKIKSSSVHKQALGIPSSSTHQDYCCCRCTHALCHVGVPDPILAAHPLRKFHPLVSK